MELTAIIKDYESAVARGILYCVKELPFSLGINKLVDVLRGAKSTFVIDYKLYELETFSMFPNFTKKQLSTVIENMIIKEILNVEFINRYNNMPVIIVGPFGDEFFYGDIDIELNFVEELIDKEVPILNPEEKELFEILRKLRNKLAKEESFPPYIVCGDKVLRELVKKKPKDEKELKGIHGVGEKFAEKYGDLFLEEIRNNL